MDLLLAMPDSMVLVSIVRGLLSTLLLAFSLFSFWKIEERNNKPIDIGRPNRFFQCIISGSNGIHRYRKKPPPIEIFSFDHISIVNTIYKDRYYKEYYTLDREISIAC
ncbi:hypothetical protein CASFOL_009529 [Castilleja foliolosa]|uniref:Uncharacterized protein n=1 Tax=Castilleja foliolosa TaxID=1961234 RepID=A0ABD3DY77_9LAMI